MTPRNVRTLLPLTTCPHCWEQFRPADVLAIAAHEDLRGDPRLGEDEMLRFRPSRFNLAGHPLDARGTPCQGYACPFCHLAIPEALLTTEPFFVSILGTPFCGKSFYLAALTWQLRHWLLPRFAIDFAEPDPVLNRVINGYENSLFMRDTSGEPVPLGSLIQKTDLAGNMLYSSVSFGNQRVLYPRPFIFTLRPSAKHRTAEPDKLSRVLCLYDNPGEHFLPGADTTAQPTTRHLARSHLLLYLFDPTQDPRFRNLYRHAVGRDLPAGPTARQEQVLREAAARIRKLTGLNSSARHNRPLVVVLTKFDSWRDLFDVPGDEPYAWTGQIAAMDRDMIENRSSALRQLLLQSCPEVISAAEEFARQVIYWPASPLGTPPVQDDSGVACLAPGPVHPVGVLAPLLIGLGLNVPGLLIPAKRPGATSARGDGRQVKKRPGMTRDARVDIPEDSPR